MEKHHRRAYSRQHDPLHVCHRAVLPLQWRCENQCKDMPRSIRADMDSMYTRERERLDAIVDNHPGYGNLQDNGYCWIVGLWEFMCNEMMSKKHFLRGWALLAACSESEQAVYKTLKPPKYPPRLETPSLHVYQYWNPGRSDYERIRCCQQCV